MRRTDRLAAMCGPYAVEQEVHGSVVVRLSGPTFSVIDDHRLVATVRIETNESYPEALQRLVALVPEDQFLAAWTPEMVAFYAGRLTGARDAEENRRGIALIFNPRDAA